MSQHDQEMQLRYEMEAKLPAIVRNAITIHFKGATKRGERTHQPTPELVNRIVQELAVFIGQRFTPDEVL